jgi:hypothetical protein
MLYDLTLQIYFTSPLHGGILFQLLIFCAKNHFLDFLVNPDLLLSMGRENQKRKSEDPMKR